MNTTSAPAPDAGEPIGSNPGRDPGELHAEFETVWGNPTGWRSLSIVNHTNVARRMMITGAVFFLIAGLLGMLLRAQLAQPGGDFMGAQTYNQVFTMHGSMMMFLFAVPIQQGLAAYLLPKMLGARDLVFPRLGAFGYWCYLFGGLIFTSSLVWQLAPDAGWFMYTPLSSNVYSPGMGPDFWLLGITFIEIATIAAAIDIVVSILRSRAAGLGLHQLPIFAWAMLVTSLMVIVGFPPLVLGSILLELERAAGWAFFDPQRGGDPLLWQHLFWLFGHPEVYIIFLPAAGVVSLLVPVFARRPLVAYRWVVVSIIGVGFISFGLWVHHMFAVGIPALSQAFFSMASMLVAVPTGIQLFAWLATLWSGRPVWSVPMLWVAGFLVIFVAGGLTGVMLAFVPFNWQVHDTHFVVAHFHYVLVGGMLFPLIAGIYYWLPHFTGRMPSERLSRAGFWLTFIGFNGTFLIMHWTGLMGMPRRVYTYDTGLGWDLPNLVSSVFSFVMAFGIATLLLDLLLHGRFGRKAPPNPWGADTLEWASGTPPKSYNFASLPPLPTRQPLWDDPGLMERIEQGRYALPSAAHGRRETLGVDPVSGRPREVIHLPGNSWWPLVAAVMLGLLCVALLLKSYTTALVLVALALAVLLRWSWENGAHPAAAAGEAHGLPQGLRLHSRTFDGPGLWGMGLAVLADAALFAALLFGWLYLWTLVPGSTYSDSVSAHADAPLRSGLLGLAALLLVGGQWLLGRTVRRLRAGEQAGLLLRLWGVAGCGGLAFAALLAWWLSAEGQPTLRALDAVQGFTALYLLLHTGLAAVLALLQAERVRRGYVGLFAPYEPAVLLIWWRFTAVAVLLVALLMGLLPLVLELAS